MTQIAPLTSTDLFSNPGVIGSSEAALKAQESGRKNVSLLSVMTQALADLNPQGSGPSLEDLKGAFDQALGRGDDAKSGKANNVSVPDDALQALYQSLGDDNAISLPKEDKPLAVIENEEHPDGRPVDPNEQIQQLKDDSSRTLNQRADDQFTEDLKSVPVHPEGDLVRPEGDTRDAQEIISQSELLKNLGDQKVTTEGGEEKGVKEMLKEKVGDFETDPDAAYRADALLKFIEKTDAKGDPVVKKGERNDPGNGKIDGYTDSDQARPDSEAGRLQDFLRSPNQPGDFSELKGGSVRQDAPSADQLSVDDIKSANPAMQEMLDADPALAERLKASVGDFDTDVDAAARAALVLNKAKSSDDPAAELDKLLAPDESGLKGNQHVEGNTPLDQQSDNAAKVVSLLNEIDGHAGRIEAGHIGDADDIQKKIDAAGLGDVDVSQLGLPSSLTDHLNKEGGTTLNQLINSVDDVGAHKLDDLIDAASKGDHSKDEELSALLSGSDSNPSTGNVLLANARPEMLPKTQAYIDSLGDRVPGGDPKALDLGAATQLAHGAFDENPKDVGSLMNGFERLASGKSDAAATLADAVNSGSAGVHPDDKIDPDWIVPGSSLDKVLDGKTDITYGQLLDIAHNEGTTAQSDLKDKLTRDLADLNSAVDPGFMMSPGNDPLTVQQNLERVTKELDPSDPNSKLNQISDLSNQVSDDMAKLANMGIKSPSNDSFMQDVTNQIGKLQGKTEDFFSGATDFFKQASGNIDGIRDRQKKEELYNAMGAAFSGLAVLGSVGFGVSNGLATARQLNTSLSAAAKGNGPASFGSGTLFLNNSVQAGIAGDRLQTLQDQASLNPSMQPLVDQINAGGANLSQSFDDMAQSMRDTYANLNAAPWRPTIPDNNK